MSPTPEPSATPVDSKSYVYFDNQTGVNVTLEIWRNGEWEDEEVSAGSGIRVPSDYSNMFVRFCPVAPRYVMSPDKFTVYPKRRKEGAWLPTHDIVVNKEQVIVIRPGLYRAD